MGLTERADHESFDGHALVDPLHHRQRELAAHQAGDHDLAAARGDGDREGHRLLVAGEIDDLVEAAFGLLQDTLDHVGLGRVVGDCGAVLQRGIPGGRREVGDRDRLLEHRLRERQAHHADAAKADQQEVALARTVDQALERAVGGDAGAHQGRGLVDGKGIVVEQVFRVGHQHVAGEAAVDGDAEEALLDAEVLVAVLAIAALAAADPWEDGFPGADEAGCYVRADFVDDAGDLVAEREGQRHAARGVELLAAAEIGIAVLDVQVGMAEAAALDAHQHFAASRLGRVDDGLAQRRIELDQGLPTHQRHFLSSGICAKAFASVRHLSMI